MIDIDRIVPRFDEPVTALMPSILGGGAAGKVKSKALVEQMICGYVSKVEPSEIIQPTVITTFSDLALLPAEGRVICFTPTNDGPALLRLVTEHADLIGVDLIALRGYPGADDSAHYSQAIFDLPEIAYNELIADAATDRRLGKMDRDQAGSRQKTKPKEVALERERVNHFDDFEQHKGLTDDTGDSE